jgi:transcriptional regulator GlxA family with amidase domain
MGGTHLPSFLQSKPARLERRTKPKINIGIFIFGMVELLDFAGPFEVFARTRLVPGSESRRSEDSAPFHVFTVSKSEKLRILPHFCFEAAPPIELLVIPGGFGRFWRTEQHLIGSALPRLRHNGPPACARALLLAQAGLLNGKRATTHWGALLIQQISDSLHSNIHVEHSARVVDDGGIGSAGISAGIDMAFYVVEQMFGKEVADETAHYMETLAASVEQCRKGMYRLSRSQARSRSV